MFYAASLNVISSLHTGYATLYDLTSGDGVFYHVYGRMINAWATGVMVLMSSQPYDI